MLSEYIFILSKLKIISYHDDKVTLFAQHTKASINSDILQSAYTLCKKIDFCKNINDAIHLLLAEQHCDRLVTFDKDFKRVQKETKITIEIYT